MVIFFQQYHYSIYCSLSSSNVTKVFRQHGNVIIEPISHHFRIRGTANKWKGGESSAGGFRKKEVHEGDENRGETRRRDGTSGTELSEAASLEIASKSLVSVTLASDMPAGRD